MKIRGCPNCKASNRTTDNGKVPRCGKCHEPLLPSFFFRFYDRLGPQIDHTMAMIRAQGHFFLEERGPIRKSVNAIIPKNSVQVDLYFDTVEDRDRLKDDKLCMRIYGDANGVGNVVMRDPKDMAYEH